MRVMASVTSVFMLNNYFLYVLLGKKVETPYVAILAAATLAQVGIDLVLLPRIGIVGAAIGMIAMGVVVHCGQVALLLTSGWLRARDAARMEAFVAVVVLLTVVASAWRLQPVSGSAAMVSLVIATGMCLLLTRGDRRWIRARLELCASFR
jgi:O-antigen/teichoic acid export membrane protein